MWQARIRAKRLAMGLSENAPYAADTPINSSDDEEETDEYDSEEEEERREKERRAAKDKRAAAISPFYELNKRKKEEADFERQRGAPSASSLAALFFARVATLAMRFFRGRAAVPPR